MDEVLQEPLDKIWEAMDGRKGDLIERCEEYARWTVPSAFPEDVDDQRDSPTESKKGNVAIGARLVNHLSHRVIDTMFPSDRSFFAVTTTPEARKRIADDGNSEEFAAELQKVFADIENDAMRMLNLTEYRPIAVNAMTLKIITGNALIFRNPKDERMVYDLHDYCVERTISGKLIKVILKDTKRFSLLPKEVQEAIIARKGKMAPEAPINLYSYFYKSGGKWHFRQAADEVEIPSSKTTYNNADFPCLVLTWNLGRGDSYGRGLVEDYAVSFHNIDVLTEAMIDLVGVASDIKFLVNDSSTFDVDAWNRAKRGEYLPGKEGDITVPQFKFAVEVQVIADSIQKLERELAQAFLLSSGGVRDAERVTAEEIRYFAREIESAFGGLYSRLALDWQAKEAEYLLSQLNFKSRLDGIEAFETVVTTGLESLSREGKLDALRMAIADAGMLDAVPEDLRVAINPLKFMNFIFRNRNVSSEEFMYTEDEMQDNQEAAMAQQQQLMQDQGAVDVAKQAATK